MPQCNGQWGCCEGHPCCDPQHFRNHPELAHGAALYHLQQSLTLLSDANERDAYNYVMRALNTLWHPNRSNY
jgi:hypothetical protein